MKTFKPNDLQKKLGSVFNSVQADGIALIDSRSRPKMILVLEKITPFPISKTRLR